MYTTSHPPSLMHAACKSHYFPPAAACWPPGSLFNHAMHSLSRCLLAHAHCLQHIKRHEGMLSRKRQICRTLAHSSKPRHQGNAMVGKTLLSEPNQAVALGRRPAGYACVSDSGLCV
jgi:hypothetical protein